MIIGVRTASSKGIRLFEPVRSLSASVTSAAKGIKAKSPNSRQVTKYKAPIPSSLLKTVGGLSGSSQWLSRILCPCAACRPADRVTTVTAGIRMTKTTGPMGGVMLAIINKRLMNIAHEKNARGCVRNSAQPSQTHRQPLNALRATACINLPLVNRGSDRRFVAGVHVQSG